MHKGLPRALQAPLLLAALTLAFYSPVLLFGQWLPAGGGDLASFLYPNLRYAAQQLHAGQLPLWNPFLYAGAPFLADNQSALFYPPNLLVMALSPQPGYSSMQALVMLHTWLAGLGLYVLARALHISRPGGLIGATAFMFCDLFITHIGNLNLNAVASHLPWLIWAFARLRDVPDVKALLPRATLAGVVFGISVLAGHAQMTLYLAYALALLLLGQAIHCIAGQDRARSLLRLCGGAGLAGIIAFGVAALSLLPTLEMLPETARSQLAYAEAAQFSLHPHALGGFFVPDVFGRGPGAFWAPWPRTEHGYLGVVPLLLVAPGIVVSVKARSPIAVYLLVLAALGMALALGDATPVHRLAFDWLPGFSSVRAPARFLLYVAAAFAVFAGFGFDGLRAALAQPAFTRHALRRWLLALGIATFIGGVLVTFSWRSVTSLDPALITPEHTLSLITGVAIFAATSIVAMVLFLLTAKGHLPRRWLPVCMLAITAIDLIGHGAWVELSPNDPTRDLAQTDVINFLRSDPDIASGLYRIDSDSGAWPPNLAELHGLRDVSGIYNPLTLGRYSTYRWSYGERGSALYDAMGVKYLLWDKGFQPADRSFELVFESDRIGVLRNTQALPRVRLLSKSVHVASGEEALEAIHRPDVDVRNAIVVQNNFPPLAGATTTTSGTARLIHDSGNRIEIAASTSSPAYLLLADSNFPAWQVRINDAPAEIHKANFAFQAVLLPAGEHNVIFTFESTAWKIGAVVSAITWICLLVGLLRWLRK